ncbi:siderophore-interacting protein [Parafrigoribacterium mesophilum]|uniref:siderophore-interacting protein n=1 Tax=Parafrigoribacterium mesophilum TaxID=433646 RepID=UPI0031FD0AF1
MIHSDLRVRHDPATRTLSVARTTQLTPGFVRITLEGAELDGFTSVGPADHVKVTFGGIGGADQAHADAQQDAVTRDYTPRLFRPGTGDTLPQLDLDFFAHAGVGPATQWARGAAVTDTVTVRGPRASRMVPAGMSRIILVADESALPAFARWIELVPESVEILGLVELENEADAAYLDPAHVNRARVVWLDKSTSPLERALRSLGPIDDNTHVWAAGEATTLIPIRRYLRRELSLAAFRVKVDGYWKRGEAGRNHHLPIDPADPED